MKYKVLLADDHEILRAGLRLLLETSSQEFEVVGECSNGHEAIEAVARLCPDLVLMDLSMPDLNGIDACKRVRERCPKARVIGLSASSHHQQVVDMLQAGASGFVVKSDAFDEVLRALRAVVSGRTYLSPVVAGAVVDLAVGRHSPDSAPHRRKLSPREREVIQLLAEGNSTKEIAARLGLSVKTVETHRKQIMDKLEIRTVAGLTRYAIEEGIAGPLTRSGPF
jgi:DNA-binding NarL/FixJ family response regulator